MRIEADAVVPHPRELVFRTYRDDLPRLVDAMSHVNSIDVEKRTVDGPIVSLTNVWAASGPIPVLAQKVIPKVVTFRDYAQWDETDFTAQWNIESGFMKEAVRCTGTNAFVDLSGRTRFEMQGEIRIDLGRIMLMPEVVTDGIANAVEKFLVRQITSSLVSVADALTQYLGQTRTQPSV